MSTARCRALFSKLLSQKLITMKKISQKNKIEKTTTLDGMMTFGKLDNGLNALDFSSFEAVEMESFVANCKVQAMRDGNVYITELPRRVRNKPLFREDNSSLTLGRDGRYYFVFALPAEQVKALPEMLVHQSLAIAQKVERMIMDGKEATE